MNYLVVEERPQRSAVVYRVGVQPSERPRASFVRRGFVARSLPHGGGRSGGGEEDEAQGRPLLPLLPAGLTSHAGARGRIWPQ